MPDLSKWKYYYNLEGTELVRANLVYTPYVSPDNTTFCMSFNRDPKYHRYPAEETQWTQQDLVTRFEREIKFHERASTIMPTLAIKDIDISNRQIFLEWHGDDFLMQSISKGYDTVLPDWQTQWRDLIRKMWSINISKFSLHPNSWTVKDGVLIPFNWFFCYDTNASPITIRSVLQQISTERLQKIKSVLEQNNLDLDTPYDIKTLQKIAFNSFRSNYPNELIDSIIQELK
ncbi:hypothetical protein UFOVP181_184 [uncultured Caudovirales phage]|uniref:Uncharacterized protein n=1 Tax=uncultured Caudovirales phage TaxID=2100421 RepID=A0A6J7WEF7_9CAUD|nr:hypothetical protein UFOVP57_455 [uncultured Caudovirales phage]CAB5208795.1 hypothetical protein UFOVP181_184 [uncultured Caudovirales phage]